MKMWPPMEISGSLPALPVRLFADEVRFITPEQVRQAWEDSLSEPTLINKWLYIGTWNIAGSIAGIENNEIRAIAAHLLDIVHADVLQHQEIDFDFSDGKRGQWWDHNYWDEIEEKRLEFFDGRFEFHDRNCDKIYHAFPERNTVSSVVMNTLRGDFRPLKTVAAKWMLRWVADHTPEMADDAIVRLAGLMALNKYRKLDAVTEIHHEDMINVPAHWDDFDEDFASELLFACVVVTYEAFISS